MEPIKIAGNSTDWNESANVTASYNDLVIYINIFAIFFVEYYVGYLNTIA